METQTEFYVYVLKSLQDRKRYVGMTDNIERRLSEHHRGNVLSTKTRRPFILVYHEKFSTRSEARQREKYFKTAAGRRYLDKLETKH